MRNTWIATLSVSLLACNLQVAWAYNISAQQIVQDLQASLSPGSEVVLASDPAFSEDFTARFSDSGSPTFVIGAKPALVTDVQKVVQYASSYDLPFLATGGGHGYTWALSRLQNGIQLDLGNFQTIDVDTDSQTMTVGGAVRIGNATAELYALGQEFPFGMCPTVGVAGLTMGGGVGPLGGFYGASSDSLLCVEMVTGTGEILNVSASEHPDLFYGIRGAGFNYGVVTSLKYQIYPATNGGSVTVVNAMFPGPSNASVFEATGSFVGQHPKELSILYSIHYNATMGGMIMWGSFIYFGPQQDALDVIKPFLDLNPLYVEVTDAAYDNFSSVALYEDVADVGPAKGIHFAPYTLNLYKVDVENMVDVVNFMNDSLTENPDLQGATLSWAQYSTEGFMKYPVESSAFPYRDAVVYFSIDGFANNASQVPLMDQFGQELRTRVQRGSGRPDLEAYVHFGHGDEGPAAWYTENKLPRLRELKDTYDPNNLFSWYNPVVEA